MWVSTRLTAMGTLVTIKLEADGAPELLEACQEQIEVYEQLFSFHRPDSALNAVNRAAGKQAVPCPDPLFDLISQGKEASLMPGSFLNIALGPLTKAWQFGKLTSLPEASAIDQLLDLCQPQDIQVNASKKEVFLQRSGMLLDLGALAKGYTADHLLNVLKLKGVRSVLLDFGGNLVVYGPGPQIGGTWAIGIQKPFAQRGQHLGQLKLTSGTALATSGRYERQTQLEGKCYHHLIDPQTGYPLTNPVTGLTVLAPTALETEIWTSRLMGLSGPDSIERLNQEPRLEGLVTTNDHQLLLTEGLKEHFRPHYH